VRSKGLSDTRLRVKGLWKLDLNISESNQKSTSR
jgi:hypothetical protein